MITLGVPCFRRYDLLQKLLESAERGTVKPDRYMVIDNGSQLRQQIAGGSIALPANTEIHNFNKNIGVSTAWNKIFRSSPDWVVISNDDVEFAPDMLEKLVRAAETSEAEYLFPGSAGSMFCVFLLKQSGYTKIGPFDENFYPAYFEDNDYHRRMKLLNIHELQVPDAGYLHVGSAYLKSLSPSEMQQHHSNFRRNQNYYVHKWGGPPGHESLTQPRLKE